MTQAAEEKKATLEMERRGLSMHHVTPGAGSDRR